MYALQCYPIRFLAMVPRGIGYYLAGFCNSAGVNDETTILDLNLGASFMSGTIAICGAKMANSWGRRKVIIMIQACLCLCCWIGVTAGTAIYAETGDATASIVGIVFFWLFQAVFAFGFTPLQVMYPVEVLSHEMRVKGMSINSMANSASTLVNQFGTATALERIGWKTYLVFGCWIAFQRVLSWRFFVEASFTLEELDDIFEAPNPKKESLRRHKLVIEVGSKRVVAVEDM